MAVSNQFSVTVQSSVPSWVPGLTLNAWTTLGNVNTFQAVKAPNIGQGNADGVFTAWGGAALATGQGSHGSFVHWNGGHTDYYGNEVYRFDLSTLTWSRLNETSPSPFSSTSWPDGLRNDGNPAVPHTYYFVGYRPNGNQFYTTRRETTNAGGGGVYKVSRFDLDTNTWTNSTASNSLTNIDANGSAYDSSRDMIWLTTSNNGFDWASYNPNTDAWTTYTGPSGAYSPGPLVYVPTKDCMVFFAFGQSFEYGLDPASPNTQIVTLTTSGTPPSTNGGDMPCWSSNLGAIVYYPSRSSSIYLLTPPVGDWRTGTWTWSQRSVTGTVTHDSGAGTYGKFQVAEWGSYTVGIYNGRYNGSCQAVRLA